MNADPISQSQRDLLAAYAHQRAALSSQNDEMLAADGTVKPVWSEFIDHLSRLEPTELGKRFARGDQYLRDAGVLYRQYDETLSTEREWPLSHIPVIMNEADWQTISEGLIERADLLEYIVKDFYGANELVASGQLPATIITQNPAWLRPMVGASAPDVNFLNFLSFEIGRGPDGQWWVISDLVEAPSSAGFAIENRMAMNRVFPNFFKNANIHRLAGFFQSFQQNLFDLRGRSDGAIALLSPGPMNQNYAEHAYLARYMGLLLVEGEDLIVQDGKTMVRTVAGPKPLSVLWNRVPSFMADPLELDHGSMLGVPGLVQALRDRSIKTLNAVGAGVLETRALMAFIPKIARRHLGHGLTMPNIATWWCGQENQRDHVLANSERMLVGSAFSTTPLMADQSTLALGAELAGSRGTSVTELIKESGRNFVGQEAVTLSTTPTYQNGELVARPMSIRIFLARTQNGWQVMPGGYARISASKDAKALAMQSGGQVADVWVVSPGKVEKSSLQPTEAAAITRQFANLPLPSRAADNLFWLGRYVERSEQNMRLFRAYFTRVSEGSAHDDPSLVLLRKTLMGDVEPHAATMAQNFSDPLNRALKAASRIGDRFSPDGMMALRALVQDTHALENKAVLQDEIPIEISALLRQITGFAGLVHENMYRSGGWRFLSLGLSLERAANMCDVLATCTAADAANGALDLALELGDSVVAHRARYSIWATPHSVVDLLGLDKQNPRSVHYHISRAKNHINELPHQSLDYVLPEAARRALRLETKLATSQASYLTPDMLGQIKQDIWDISSALSNSHLV